MKNLHIAVALGAMVLVPYAKASDDAGQKSVLTFAEKKFVEQTAMDLMLEVRLSNQVLLDSSSPKLQFIAKNNVSFYTGMLIDLREFALANHVSMPAKLDSRHEAAWNRISPLTGAELAQAYLNFTALVDLHLKVSYRHMAGHAKSNELRVFAREQAVILAKKK